MDCRQAEQNATAKTPWEWIFSDEFRHPLTSIQTILNARVLSLLNWYRKPPLKINIVILIKIS